jgi:pSer/pThr/pTyr-binding forkhead associated (FHA) protein
MPYQLVVIKGRSSSQTLKVSPEGVTTVGRLDGCQIRISSSQVSRKHCELFEKKGLLLVKDLGSSNGTFVNGKKIDGQQVLEPGNMLTIGAITFRIERTDVPGAVSAPERKPSDTAVGEAVPAGAGDEDDIEIDFDADDETIPDPSLDLDFDDEDKAPQPAAAKAAPAAGGPGEDLEAASEEETEAQAPKADEPEPTAPAEDEFNENAPELGEDAVAEYLLNIDLDDEDKL